MQKGAELYKMIQTAFMHNFPVQETSHFYWLVEIDNLV